MNWPTLKLFFFKQCVCMSCFVSCYNIKHRNRGWVEDFRQVMLHNTIDSPQRPLSQKHDLGQTINYLKTFSYHLILLCRPVLLVTLNIHQYCQSK